MYRGRKWTPTAKPGRGCEGSSGDKESGLIGPTRKGVVGATRHDGGGSRRDNRCCSVTFVAGSTAEVLLIPRLLRLLMH